MERVRWLFRFGGTVTRAEYLRWGVALSLLKYAIDFAVARAFGQTWMPWGYLVPHRGVILPEVAPAMRQMFALLWAIAVPFFWMGVALTVRRLRAAGHARALAILFFVPLANLLLFAWLSVAPERRREEAPPPRGRRASAGRMAAALLATTALGVAAVWAEIFLLRGYGWGLFIALPFVLGYAAVRLSGTTAPGQVLGSASGSVMLVGLVLFGAAMEGLICLAMALPLAVPPALLGGLVAAWPSWRPATANAIALALLPLVMGVEAALPAPAPVAPVTTAVIVNAPPEKVWEAVVAFSEIGPPDELLFRAGIAYPTRARISGHGVGAVRRCEFSTGTFVEPIETWDAPRRLAFGVTEQPPVLRELSPFEVSAPHLENPLLRSHRGEFRLVRLPGGKTRLEGTTWYSLQMWPAVYWRAWSDYTIHTIHERVLRHVKKVAEGAGG